jgi:uncharacterized protein YjbI with pentapeptide repeats
MGAQMTDQPSGTKKKQEPPSWLIKNISEASVNARKIYFIYLSIIAYFTLTIISTTDRQIILNEKTHLPLLNVDVSFFGFLIIAPIILIFIFFYLQFYLNKKNELLFELRDNYGLIDNRQFYPWILNFAEDTRQGFIKSLQRSIVTFSLWYSLPLVLILFSFLFLKTHYPVFTYIVGLLPIIGTIFVLYFWMQYENYNKNYNLIKSLRMSLKNKGKIILISLVLLSQLLFYMILNGSFSIFSLGSIDLSNQILITKPKVVYGGISWANLKGVHLEGAKLTKAILEQADLREAHMQKALLNGANLSGADLWIADLSRANLSKANLSGADISGAELPGANLSYADLSRADLSGANLSGAKLSSANLSDADLSGAELTRANLSFADLSRADLEDAKFWLNDKPTECDLKNAVKQLSKVKTLFGSNIDPIIEKDLKKEYPQLFVEPESDKSD